ncbi:hypothetical protein KSP40_PGU019040 [Platanthera guangdongensis]|uniref:Thioredoxin domain-containing protein n=1 Tax=Platanthera guangdongensis TaxID=2320717 RepID=A0ABR2LP33_9ASPA
MAAPVPRAIAPSRPDYLVPAYSCTSRPRIVPVSAAVGHGRSGILPHFTGFRASARQGKLRPAMVEATVKAIFRSTVVCEAQKATVEGDILSSCELNLNVTNATWRSLVLECDKPVFVEFWASWCEPCRVIHPLIDKLSSTYEGKIRFFKLNTDDNPEIVAQYEIRSIPTVVIFMNGEKMDRIIGAVSESTLVSFIENYAGR